MAKPDRTADPVAALRALGTEGLAGLLAARPDLADPPPESLDDLAARAAAPYSLQACTEGLEVPTTVVLHALVLLGEPSGVDDVLALVGVPEPGDRQAIAASLSRLHALGLATRHGVGPDAEPHFRAHEAVVRTVSRPLGLQPSLLALLERCDPIDVRTIAHNLGLGEGPDGRSVDGVARPLLTGRIAAHHEDPVRVRALLRRLGSGAEDVLEQIDGLGGDLGVDVREAKRRGELPEVLEGLLGTGLLVRRDSFRVTLPREVAVARRGGHPIPALMSSPPPVGVVKRGWRGVVELDPVGCIDAMARIGNTWALEPPVPRKSGGVAVRDVRAIAKVLGLDERSAALLVEVGGQAGLLGADPFTGRVAPTASFDDWIARPAIDRWLALAHGWSDAAASFGRLNEGDDGRGEAPLQPVWYVPSGEVWRRARVVEALDAAQGEGPADLDAVAERARWFGPGRWATGEDTVDAVRRTLAEASLLGIARGGRVSPLGRAALLSDDPEALGAAAAAVFPPPVDTFTVQADGTALAPAELVPHVVAWLDLLGDVLSRGAATLYRIGEAGVRRALDAGRTVEEVHEFLEQHARPSVPQPLRYLVDDVARRHGSVRVSGASAYVRVDDPALLAELLRHRRVAKLRLRAIAPTVAVSPLPSAKVLAGLREAGFLPVEEDADGAVLTTASRPARTVPRPGGRARDRSRAQAVWSSVRVGAADGAPDAGGGAVEAPPLPDPMVSLARRLLDR